ncbi:MAG: hypothetical protein JSV90_07725 [Methanobacteriota archaeon]|nr:MAG: hypothetical protein JSV90_07725 [Euryarchaeota archaeon]
MLGPFEYMIPHDTEWVINWAYVDAWDHQWHYVYAESSWEIEVFHPMIEICKWEAREFTCAHEGEEVSYYIEVRNPSWDATMYAEVYDPMLGGLLWTGYLAPGGSVLLGPYLYVVPEGAEWVNNTAYVDAWDHQWHYRYAEASWTMEILYPDIEVTKEGPEVANIGETITYRVEVTNTGDTELYDVYVVDSLVGALAGPLMLAIGETIYLSYDYIVPAGEGTLDNVVSVEGRDRQYVWVYDEARWAVYKYGEISGFKTADLNLNGGWDEGEPGLMNWVIQLTGELVGGGWDNRTMLTDSGGFYEFTGLGAGVYTVSEVMQAGWTATTVTSYTVTVGSGTVLSRSFGNIPYGSICGYKWLDSNMDGVWDEGEEPIPGWTIFIYGEDVSGYLVDDFTVTDENGMYCFDGLLPGLYSVYEELREGWIPTTPASVVVDVSAIEPFEITCVNFGNVKYGQITGYKWLDEWMNGIWDGHEVALEGWTIELTGVLSDGSLFGPVYATTDSTGFYCFCDLLPGTYVVRELIPAGWTNITPDQYEVTLDMADEVFCAKFGNVEYGMIDGWKFVDWDMDGFFDGVEEGLEGWQITLEGWLNDGIPPYSLDGTYVGPFVTYTDENGYWYFDNLLPGVYKVTEESRSGWYATTPMERWIIVTSGSYIFDVKFGNVPYTCLWGYKFEDINGDGRWAMGEEPGLPGWTIVVEGVQNDGVPVYIELITDQDGYWATCFIILPGEYWIYEMPQEGWVQTTPDMYWFCIPMAMGPMEYEFLFGNFKLGKICGYKYEDMNGNGVLDEGDVPIAGWEMYLTGAASGMTSTNEDGYFCFDGLTYGVYTVTEESRSGWAATTPTSHTVTILSGTEVCLPVFLNVEYSIVWGYKFEDKNSNGVWDEGEDPIPGWKITMMWNGDFNQYETYTDESGYYEFTGLLPSDYYYVWEETPAGWTWTTTPYEEFPIVSGTNHRVHDFGNFMNVIIWVFKFEDVNSNGVYDEGDHPLEGWEIMVSGPGVPGGTVTLMTGADGWASVEVTAAGMYEVMEMVPPGWTPTTPTMEMVFVESGCCDPCEVMFGNFRDVTITLFKYEDMNSNGVYDDGDVPIPGWEFYFENHAGTESFTVTTGIDGSVSVTFQSSDVWNITEEMPAGWVPINPATGMVQVLILSNYAYSMNMQMECYYYEFGNFHCVDILVFKYWDKCSNGWYDPDFDDEPLPGWYFELRDATGALLDCGYTNESGELLFTVCRAGVYYVIEEDREGWTHIDPASGYFEVEVSSGDSLIRLWFANYLDVDVPIFKYEDRNSNGEFDEGDVPVEGWYFEMTREGSDTVYSGYTDANGELVLTVNRSGLYTLVEEDRMGWTPINPASGARLLSITSGTAVPVQMFGNFRDVTIWIFKFEDVNSNGEYDEGDHPLEGWSFTVTGPWSGSGTVVTTGPDGFATIVVDRAGMYTVTEEDREGWTHTTPCVLDIYVWSSMQEEPLLFGNFKDVEITVFKFEDVNSNGMYDEGVDVPLEGWLMMLYTEFHGEIFYAHTDATGHATFTLTYSDYVYVYEDLPIGWVQTCPETGSYDFWVYSGWTFPVLEFGNFHCVWIEVFKYEDVNSNGVYDEGDRPVEGWHFYLYDPTGMPCGEAVTDVNGQAWFLVCRAGIWIVEEEMREHVTPINPASGLLEVEVWSGAIPQPLMFGNFWDVLIIVFKYEDMNSNGVYDDGDEPIPEWMFEISGPGVTNAVEYTDGTGHAYFWVNRAGTYTVTEEDREGWTHVNPADGNLDVTVMSGCMPEPLMFGNFEDVIIIIFKFDDRYGDGQYCPEEGDVPLEGWVFELYILVGEDWVLVATATTDSDGYAQFVVTQAGVYKVVEVLLPGWFIILPVGGEYIVEVMSGYEPIWLVFANFKLGMIFGWKWNDLNGNGEWDEGEPGLPGWTIRFECWFWVGEVLYYLYGEDTTDENGYYEFTGLPPGLYTVWEDLMGGWVPTSPPEVEVEVIGHTEARVDFLNFELGCVWGYKFEDYNGNGVFDDGDTPLPEWHIYLYLHDALIATTMTDGDGYYSFCDLGPGVYTVTEESRVGWTPTSAPSEVFAMTSGASIRVHDFLNFEFGMITGYKFEDLNSNGEWDEGEPAIEDWQILLALESDPPASDHTNEDGYYEFGGLMAGTYTVWEDDVVGWTHTTPPMFIVEIFSGSHIEVCPFGNFRNVSIEIFKYEDVDGNGVYNEGDHPIPGWMFTVTGPCFPTPLVVYTDGDGEVIVWITMAGTYVVTEEDRGGWMHVNPESGSVTFEVLSGDLFEPFMFGNFMLGEITGQKFYDWNLNGIKDEGEVGLANWVIWINGTLVGGGYLNFTLLTDSSGFYQVSGLPAGVYVVSERLEFAPAGWVPTLPTTVVVDITSASAVSVSFANAVFGIVEGYKFYDKNQNGVWDEGEPGLAGWTIILEGVTDEGVAVYRTTATNSTGHYLFEDVQPGVYEVTEVVQLNWAPTTPLPVTVDASGAMEYFEAWVYIGNIRFAKVFGYKFLDTIPDCYPYWPNGIFDEYEYGLSDWEITLEGWTETGEYISMVRYTDEFGYYEFTDLLPGTYWINETLLWGWYASRPVSNMVIIFPYPAGMVIFRIDFGNVLPEPDPEVPFVLEEGWNLWSTPIVVDGLTASALLDAIGPHGLAVTMLDNGQGKYESYVAGMSPERDFPIVTGLGYFVYVTADTAFTLRGSFESQPKADLVSGWNLIGYSSLRPVMASELLEMVDGSYGLALTYYDKDEGQYESYVAGFSSERDFVVTPGNAYYIWVGGPCELVFG